MNGGYYSNMVTLCIFSTWLLYVTIVTNQPLPNLNGGHDADFRRRFSTSGNSCAADETGLSLPAETNSEALRLGTIPGFNSETCPFPDDKRHQKTGKSSEAPRVYLELCLMVLVYQTLYFHQKDIIGFNSWK